MQFATDAKGKIERRFGTLQKRLVAILAGQRQLNFPVSDNADHQIDFLGQSWPIAPTKRSAITLIHHPLRQFWAVTEPPSPPRNHWPEILGQYSL